MGGKVSGLYWLVRKAKDLVVPRVVFIEGPALEEGASGCYYHPFWGEMVEFATGRLISLESGLLVLPTAVDDEGIWGKNGLPETLAHEWRHHWQWFNQVHCRAATWTGRIPYQEEIVSYFGHPREMDALLFSHSVAPSEITKMWLSMIKENA